MSLAVRIIVQSRMTSTRLPGKALLPIRGIPLVALCALRAGNTGREVVVATSTETSDDPIAETMRDYDVPTFRGSLSDVLARFAAATSDLPNEAVVLRLTADNVVPDGAFVDELVDALLGADADFAGPRYPEDGLPYGLVAEAFRVSALRKADAQATSLYDRDSVTPWIIRNLRTVSFRPAAPVLGDLSRLRCTIDDVPDYVAMRSVFQEIKRPVEALWPLVVERLVEADSHSARVPAMQRHGWSLSPVTLGTAQFGSRYGVANETGVPSVEDARRILSCAIGKGFTVIDTGRAYGEAESRIGSLTTPAERAKLKLITKLAIDSLPADTPDTGVANAVDASVFRSCRELRVERLDALLVHRWRHHDAWNSGVWKRLLALRADGVIQRLGASVYTPEEAERALHDPDVEVLQLPTNVFDWRWRESPVPDAVAKRDDVVIQGRSVFLQGAALLPAGRWPITDPAEAARLANALDELRRLLGRRDRRDLCIAYARSLPWVHTLVMGAETEQQVDELAEFFLAEPLTPAARREVEDRLGRASMDVLDPRRWPIYRHLKEDPT